MRIYVWRDPMMNEVLVVMAESLDEARAAYRSAAVEVRLADDSRHAAAIAAIREWSAATTGYFRGFPEWVAQTDEGRAYRAEADADRLDPPGDEADRLVEREPVAVFPCDAAALVAYRAGGTTDMTPLTGEWLCRFLPHKPVRGRPYPNFVVIWCERCHVPMSDRTRLLPSPPHPKSRR